MRYTSILRLSEAFAPTSRISLASLRPRATVSRVIPVKIAISKRFASISPSDDESSVRELITKLNENPEIRDILQKFQSLLVSKGLNPEKPPSMMEIMRLFSDKEVRELAGQLKGKFDEAGIQISPDQMTSFMGMFKK